jgi:hypothetical protein
MEAVDLLGFGVAAVDDIVQVPAFPAAGSKTHITSIQRQGGGQCATALVAAARLGLRCRYAGVLGRNELSDFVRQTLERNGIEVIERHAHPEAMPCYSMVVVDGSTGERTILSYLHGMVAPDDIGVVPLKFEHAFYCKKCGGVVSAKTCPHGKEDWVFLSGTQVRQMLERGEMLPAEFTRPEVARVLLDGVKKRDNAETV